MFGYGMMIWPELRGAYHTHTGNELAQTSLDEFVGFVLHYSVSLGPDVGKLRQSFYDVIWERAQPSDEFDDQALTQVEQLEALEQHLRRGVE